MKKKHETMATNGKKGLYKRRSIDKISAFHNEFFKKNFEEGFRMKKGFLVVLLMGVFLLGNLVSAEAQTASESAKSAGKSISNTSKEVGNDIKKGSQEFGKDVKEGAQQVGKDASAMGKEVGQGFKKGSEEVGKGFKEGAKGAGK